MRRVMVQVVTATGMKKNVTNAKTVIRSLRHLAKLVKEKVQLMKRDSARFVKTDGDKVKLAQSLAETALALECSGRGAFANIADSCFQIRESV